MLQWHFLHHSVWMGRLDDHKWSQNIGGGHLVFHFISRQSRRSQSRSNVKETSTSTSEIHHPESPQLCGFFAKVGQCKKFRINESLHYGVLSSFSDMVEKSRKIFNLPQHGLSCRSKTQRLIESTARWPEFKRRESCSMKPYPSQWSYEYILPWRLVVLCAISLPPTIGLVHSQTSVSVSSIQNGSEWYCIFVPSFWNITSSIVVEAASLKDLSWHCIQKDILLRTYRITSTSSLQGGDSNCWERALPISHRIDQGVVCLPTFIVDFMVNVRMEIHHTCILWVYIVFLHLFP